MDGIEHVRLAHSIGSDQQIDVGGKGQIRLPMAFKTMQLQSFDLHFANFSNFAPDSAEPFRNFRRKYASTY